MKKKLSFSHQKLHVNKLDRDIKGDFISREYTITKGDEVIATVKKGKLLK